MAAMPTGIKYGNSKIIPCRKILYTMRLKCMLNSQTKPPRSDCLLDSFIYQIFIEGYYVPGPIPGAGTTAMHQTVKNTCPVCFHSTSCKGNHQISRCNIKQVW